MKITYKDWNIEEQTGYKPLTTAYMDLSIAERFGIKAIGDTVKNLLISFNNNYKYLTELVMALNWKTWEHYESNHPTLQKLYTDMYYKMHNWCLDHLKDEELEYYLDTTD